MYRGISIGVWLSLTIALLIFGGCGDDDPVPFTPSSDCIGPEGGSVSYSRPDYDFDGARIDVAPGAWEDCWGVTYFYKTTFSTPNFPTGLDGYAGPLTGSLVVGISKQVDYDRWVDAPDSMDFSITFPRAGGFLPEVGEMVTGYRWDEAAGLWRLALPDTLDDDRLVINTNRHDSYWTWGLVNLEKADFDTYVVPAMKELHGSETWAQLEVELQNLHDSIVAGPTPINCDNLLTVRNLFIDAAEGASVRLRAFQNGLSGECGLCDVTSSEFYESVVDLARLNIQEWIYQFMFVENSPHWLLTIYGHIMIGYVHGAIENLPCDFGCFFKAGTTEFYTDLAIFYVSTVAAQAIDLSVSTGWIDCK